MLKVYAKPGQVLYVPGTKQFGVPAQYVGRKATKVPGAAVAHPATKEPHEVEPGSDLFKRLFKRCLLDANSADGAPVWAADVETAKALGIPFVDVAFDADASEWFPKNKQAVAPDTSKKGGSK